MGSSLEGPHLKQALLLDQPAFLQAPEIQMRFAAGDDDSAVCRVKVYTKHRLVGALKAKEGGEAVASCARAGFYQMHNISLLTHFHFGQSVLPLPVPDREDVLIGVIHGTERVSSILEGRDSRVDTRSGRKALFGVFPGRFHTDLEKARQTRDRSKKPEPRTWSVLRLTESHTRT